MLEHAVAVLLVRVDAVAVGRRVVVELGTLAHVGTLGVVGAPVVVLGVHVDVPRDLAAGPGARDRGGRRADGRADRAGDGAERRAGGHAARHRADAGAHRMLHVGIERRIGRADLLRIVLRVFRIPGVPGGGAVFLHGGLLWLTGPR